ncbi:hypothetical protein [Kribbella sp. NPDC023855]|uniref:hypothetical protein n=1 Tax=Kribbella sp. NPDC023855 TaxID=3154698 RepID=UPI0034117B7D
MRPRQLISKLRRKIVARSAALAVVAAGIDTPTPALTNTSKPNADSFTITNWLAINFAQQSW